jgi:hypothetical protein
VWFEVDERGGAYSTYGRDKKCTQQFSLKPEEKKPLKQLRLNRRIILKCTGILEVMCEDPDFIRVAQ